jgi:hypothetical protein
MLRRILDILSRLRYVLLALLLVGALIVIAKRGSQPTKPGADGPSQSTAQAAEIMRIQEPLSQAADRLEVSTRAAKLPGFAGIELSVPNREVILYWKGDVPKALQANMSQLTSKARIRVVAARYTREELQRHASALKRSVSKYPGLHRVGVAENGSGLEIGITDAKVGDAIAKALPVTVRTEVEQPTEPFVRDDATPVSAGASLNAFNGDSCGSGFSMWRWRISGDIFYKEFYTHAAYHCGGGIGVNYFSGGGPIVGQGAFSRRNLDSIAVRTGAAVGRMYDGGVQDGTWFFKPVVGRGTNRIGTQVCISGRLSGVHCGLRINKHHSWRWPQGGYWIDNLVEANHVDGALAAVEGDSGSPVFGLNSQSKVLAAGHLWGGGGKSMTCPPPFGSTTRCSPRIWYVDLGAQLAAHKLNLVLADDPYIQSQMVSLRSSNQPTRYIRHQGSSLGELAEVTNDLDRQDATFWRMPGLADAGGGYSFQSVNFPGHYLRHQDSRLKLTPEAGPKSDAAIKPDGTFYSREGLADLRATSLESYSAPGRFIRHRDFHLYVESGDSELYRGDATFFVTQPLWRLQ